MSHGSCTLFSTFQYLTHKPTFFFPTDKPRYGAFLTLMALQLATTKGGDGQLIYEGDLGVNVQRKTDGELIQCYKKKGWTLLSVTIKGDSLSAFQEVCQSNQLVIFL